MATLTGISGRLWVNGVATTLSAVIDPVTGNGSISIGSSQLPLGTDQLKIVSSGNSDYLGSTSAEVAEVVNPEPVKQATVTTITGVSPNPATQPDDTVTVNFNVAPA